MNGGNYYSENTSLFRLIKEYERHGSLIIAVDFDNTVYDTHNQSLDLATTIDIVKRAHKAGFEVFCFTANNDETLIRHIWARDLGINDIKINESSLDTQFNSRKPFYSLLLDDRAGLGDAYSLLDSVLKYTSA